MFRVLDIEMRPSNRLNWILKNELTLYFRLNLNVDRAKLFEDYLSKDLKTDIDLLEMLYDIADDMSTKLIGGKLILSLNNENTYYGYSTDYWARVIDKGIGSIKGLGIVSDGLDYLQNNINKILMKYIGE